MAAQSIDLFLLTLLVLLLSSVLCGLACGHAPNSVQEFKEADVQVVCCRAGDAPSRNKHHDVKGSPAHHEPSTYSISLSFTEAPAMSILIWSIDARIAGQAIKATYHRCSLTALAENHTPSDLPQLLPGPCHTGVSQCRGSKDSCAAWTQLQCQLELQDPKPASLHMGSWVCQHLSEQCYTLHLQHMHGLLSDIHAANSRMS